MGEPNPTIIINSKPPFSFPAKYVGIAIAFCLIILLIFFLLAPLDLYLNLHSVFRPHALAVNDTPIAWEVLRKEANLVSIDNHLKTRQQKLDRALEKSVELQILRSFVATPAAQPVVSSLFTEHKLLTEQVEQNLVNWRSGGYFIARFNIPQATESAAVIQSKAKTEIAKLQDRLRSGEDFNKLLEEAQKNEVLKTLNETAFLPGEYLDKITLPQFPLQIKSFRDQFFNLKTGQVSDIITLSWDDYDGPNSKEKPSGEFAYAVLRIDQANQYSFGSFEEWMRVHKQKVKVQSFVYIPFFFGWF